MSHGERGHWTTGKQPFCNSFVCFDHSQIHNGAHYEPPQGVAGRAACGCAHLHANIFCLCATYGYAHCDMRGRGAESWEIQKTNSSHKSCQVKTSCSSCILYFFFRFPQHLMPSSSSLISSTSTMAGGRASTTLWALPCARWLLPISLPWQELIKGRGSCRRRD